MSGSKTDDKLMGLITPGDQKVSVFVRHWDAQKRALWRSKYAWDIAMKEATNLLGRCTHMAGCEAQTSETAPCLPDCPDRELRLAALVILNAARQFAPVDAKEAANAPYYAPSREHFSEVLSELGACQAELVALRGSTVTQPVDTVPAPQLQEPK
jgi:hypothetical protein